MHRSMQEGLIRKAQGHARAAVCMMLAAGMAFFSFVSSAYAVDCSYYSNSVPVPAGWGVPFYLFGSQKETVMKADCNPYVNYKARLENDPSDGAQAVWQQGYYWTTTGWQAMSFVPSGQFSFADKGYAFIGAVSTQDLPLTRYQNPYYVCDSWVARYSGYYAFWLCSADNGSWKCGCTDSTCATTNWGLQRAFIEEPSEPCPYYDTGGGGA